MPNNIPQTGGEKTEIKPSTDVDVNVPTPPEPTPPTPPPHPHYQPQTVPPVEVTNNTQLEDIRIMLLDVVPDTYTVKTNDYYFSDAELMDAIRRANEIFCSLPPTSIRLGAYGIPDPYTLKVGAAWQACLAKCLYFQRKQVRYQAGSTEVDMYGSAAEGMMNAAKEYKEQFMELAQSIKRQINTNRYFGRIG